MALHHNKAQLSLAVEDLRSQEHLNYSHIAKKYSVAQTTLRDQFTETSVNHTTSGRFNSIKSFLSNILQLLAQVYEVSEEQVIKLGSQIFDRVISFAALRLRRYRCELRRVAGACL